ncbi:hypothetical protein [Micromonospora sp. NPDC049204]|uniref:hypothetical protein n=1 Tax=unclassified Micromonospora TaxID=2617518 RepID=UPI0034049E0D
MLTVLPEAGGDAGVSFALGFPDNLFGDARAAWLFARAADERRTVMTLANPAPDCFELEDGMILAPLLIVRGPTGIWSRWDKDSAPGRNSPELLARLSAPEEESNAHFPYRDP